MAAKTKVEKGLLVDLLRDEEVRAQLEALIVEILGKENGAILLAILKQIQENQGEQPAEKKGWFKKIFGWASLILPYLFKLFKRK